MSQKITSAPAKKPTMDEVVDRLLSAKDAGPPEGMSPEEHALEIKKRLLARVRVLRDGSYSISNIIRNQNPAYAYCEVFNHPQSIDYRLGRGYTFVEKEDGIETNFQRQDGRHYRGDLVLMKIRRELLEAWDAERELSALEAVEGYRGQFLDFAESQGIPAQRTV